MFRKKQAVILILMIGVLAGQVLTGCGKAKAIPVTPGPDGYTRVFTQSRSEQDLDFEEAAILDLSQYKGTCTVTEGGSYLVSGRLDGQLVVEAEDQVVHFYLQDVQLLGTTSSALNVKSAAKVILTAMPDSMNRISDSGEYSKFHSSDADAAVFAKCDITLNGDGELEILGYYQDAIHTRGIVKILDTNVSLQSKRNAIRGNAGVLLENAVVSVESEKNGIYTTKTGDDGRGNVEIIGGSVSLIGGAYGIQTSGDLLITDCDFSCQGVLADWQVAGKSYLQEDLVN